jgi:hypothetical protein
MKFVERTGAVLMNREKNYFLQGGQILFSAHNILPILAGLSLEECE